jgi:hypothetical protein
VQGNPVAVAIDERNPSLVAEITAAVAKRSRRDLVIVYREAKCER